MNLLERFREMFRLKIIHNNIDFLSLFIDLIEYFYKYLIKQILLQLFSIDQYDTFNDRVYRIDTFVQ